MNKKLKWQEVKNGIYSKKIKKITIQVFTITVFQFNISLLKKICTVLRIFQIKLKRKIKKLKL